MLKKLSGIFVAVLLVIALSSGLEAADKIKLGVLNFSSSPELIKEADEISKIFTQALSASEALTVFNRSRIDLELDAESDINAVADFGKTEGCKYILLGSVKRDRDIVISVRAVDVETAKIIFSMSTAAQSSNSVRAESMKLGDRVREKFTGEIPRVLSVNGKDVSINRGSSSGVRNGDLYRVYAERQDTMDMEGNLSGRITIDLAIVEVKSVKNDSCVANLAKNGGDDKLIAELNNYKAEAISKEETRKLISKKFFAPDAIKKRMNDESEVTHIARELNANLPVDEKYIKAVKDMAEKGHPDAQRRLGSYYIKMHDFPNALKWFREAARENNSDAYSELGYMYSNGLGVPLNYNKAFEFYLKAVEYGNHSAKNNLGMMYQQGRGVKQDYKEAFLWYGKAWTQQEDKKAKAAGANNMAYMYYNGLGVKKNIKLAMPLYREAANSGDLQAKLNLGMIYFNGSSANTLQSVKKGSPDYDLVKQSQKWFQEALEQAQKEHNDDAIRLAQEQLYKLSRIAVVE